MDPADKTAALRAAADADDRRAGEVAADNPAYSEYLERRADWRRKLARDEERSGGPCPTGGRNE